MLSPEPVDSVRSTGVNCSPYYTRLMKRIAEPIVIVGLLACAAGILWHGYFGVLLIVIGFGVIALGRALVRVARSRQINGKPPT